MVFEALLADVAQKLLQIRDFDDASAAESFERIVGEASAADVAADSSVGIVGGKPRKTHGAGLDASHAGAKRIVLAYRARNDLLKIHLHIFEKMFR